MKTNFLSKLQSNTFVDISSDFDGNGSATDEIFRIYHSNNPANRLMTGLRNGKFGIGTNQPDSLLHVLVTDTGGTAVSGTALTIESKTNCYIQLLGWDNSGFQNELGIIFGYNGLEDYSSIIYQVTGDYEGALKFRATGVNVMGVFDDGVAIGGTIRDSLVHVWKANAGTVTAISGTLLTLENNESCLISFLSGGLSSPKSGLKFGTNGNNNEAEFTYDWDDESFMIRSLGSVLQLFFEKGAIGSVSHLSTINYNEPTTQPQHKLRLAIGSGYTLAGRIGIEFENASGSGTVTESWAFKTGSDFEVATITESTVRYLKWKASDGNTYYLKGFQDSI